LRGNQLWGGGSLFLASWTLATPPEMAVWGARQAVLWKWRAARFDVVGVPLAGSPDFAGISLTRFFVLVRAGGIGMGHAAFPLSCAGGWMRTGS
jgi:hypothetical protein